MLCARVLQGRKPTFKGGKMLLKLITIFITTFFSIDTMAHEGHGIPGALPPAPHGGVVQEVEHLEKHHSAEDGHDHSKEKHAEEVELFFEAVYKNKEIIVYPLTFLKNDTSSFQTLSAKKELSEVALKVELPRAKKFESLKANVGRKNGKASD